MEFIDLSKKRESCRIFSSEKVKHDDLITILEAGRLSPSGCNLQPWHMYAVEEGNKLEALKQAISYYGTNVFVKDMKAAIVIFGDTPNYPERVQKSLCNRTFYDIDVGILVANMELCATTLGVGTCSIGCFNEDMAKAAIGVDIDKPIKLIIALGMPGTDTPREKTRKTFDDVITFVKD